MSDPDDLQDGEPIDLQHADPDKLQDGDLAPDADPFADDQAEDEDRDLSAFEIAELLDLAEDPAGMLAAFPEVKLEVLVLTDDQVRDLYGIPND